MIRKYACMLRMHESYKAKVLNTSFGTSWKRNMKFRQILNVVPITDQNLVNILLSNWFTKVLYANFNVSRRFNGTFWQIWNIIVQVTDISLWNT